MKSYFMVLDIQKNPLKCKLLQELKRNSKSVAFGRGGSSPPTGTILNDKASTKVGAFSYLRLSHYYPTSLHVTQIAVIKATLEPRRFIQCFGLKFIPIKDF